MRPLFKRKPPSETPGDIDKLLKLKRKINYRWIGFKGLFFLFFLSIALAFLLRPSFTLPSKSFVEGEPASFNIKAQRSFDIVDEDATAKLKDAAESSVKTIYDYDSKLYTQTVRKLFKAFERLKKDYFSVEGASLKEADIAPAKKSFEEALGGVRVDPAVFTFLVKTRFNWKVSWSVNRLLNLLKNRYVISEKTVLEADLDRGVTVRDRESKKEIYFDEFGHILDQAEAKKIVLEGGPKIYKEYKPSDRKFVGDLAASLVTPNLSLNKEETLKRKDLSAAEVKPIIIKVKKNEMIVRKGDAVQKSHLVILKGIRKELTGQQPGLFMFFVALFFFFFFQILGNFSLVNFSQFKPTQKDLLMVGFLILLSLLLCRGYLFVAGAISDRFPLLPFSAFLYLIPVAAGAMFVRFMVGMEAALIFSIVMSIAFSLLLERNFLFAVYTLSSCFIGMDGVASCRSVTDIYKAGLKTSLANVVVVFSILTIASLGSHQSYDAIVLELIFGMLAGFFSGMLSSFLVVTLTPLFEYIFNYTTDVKLLELSNLNHPILRDLMMRAPGSYHHSIMVGTLAEHAAEAIGANALLARVGGYYHDIGKIKNPHYYIENQFGGVNIHDREPAHLSKTMIMSHVKEGVKLGYERRLGKRVADIIEQHLGNTLMVYFYEKAKKEYEERVKKDELLPPVEENDFRYPGPKPQTREAALVMMADAVEASTRALASGNLSRVKAACEKIIHRLFSDGQFDECDLTLRDLHAIIDSFYHVLVGIYHQRISYPGGGGIKAEPYDANYNPKQTKEDQDSQAKDSEVDEKTLYKKMGQ